MQCIATRLHTIEASTSGEAQPIASGTSQTSMLNLFFNHINGAPHEVCP